MAKHQNSDFAVPPPLNAHDLRLSILTRLEQYRELQASCSWSPEESTYQSLSSDWSLYRNDPAYPSWSGKDKAKLTYYYHKGPFGRGASTNYPFKITHSEVRQGAKGGCRLFRCLLDGFHEAERDEQNRSTFESLRKTSIGRLELSANLELQQLQRGDPAALKDSTWETDILALRFNLYSFDPTESAESQILSFGIGRPMDVLTTPENPASTYVSTRPIDEDPASKESFQRIRSWISRCTNDHSRCRTAGKRSEWTPSRLLAWEATSDESEPLITLREFSRNAPRAVDISYATLSYCWGGDQRLKCRLSTVERLRKGVSLGDFPLTIRDALLVCRQTGIGFLWVDALCIMQDDPKDLAVEISNMPKIYGGASFTILAARSSSADSGFLQPRTTSRWEAETFEIPFIPPDGTPGSIILSRVKDDYRRVASEPIDTRAWIFQEQILSVRCLQFGNDQTSWRCLESDSEPGFTDGWKATADDRVTSDSSEDFRFSPVTQLLHGLRLRPFGFELDDAYFEWRSILTIYSQRLLTVPTDRILAASGVAERFGHIFEDEYLAGLWRKDLVRELLWHVTSSNGNSNLRSRPNGYQGPSWSWTSVNSGVNYSAMTRPNYLQFYESDGIGLQTLARLQKYSITLANSDAKYGAVQSPTCLQIRTRTLSGSLMPHPTRKHMNVVEITTKHTGDDATGSSTFFNVYPDTIEDLKAQASLDHVLVTEILGNVIYGEFTNSFQCCGLILQPTQSPNDCYRRIGMFHHYEESPGIGLVGLDDTLATNEKRAKLRMRVDKFRGQPEIDITII
ncbi:Fc.00g071490.m01.CDS01 [Cosmosporella sp. VM-42]